MRSSNPTDFKASVALSFIWFVPEYRKGSMTLDRALILGSRLKLWKTNPTFWLRISDRSLSERWDTFSPSRMYSPLVGTSRQPRMFIRVDLPEPDGPIIATISPRRILKVTPSRAWTSTEPILYVLRISLASITHSFMHYLPPPNPPNPPGPLGNNKGGFNTT